MILFILQNPDHPVKNISIILSKALSRLFGIFQNLSNGFMFL